MADNPLVRVPAALPVLNKANALRRKVQGRVASFDLIQWDGFGETCLICQLYEDGLIG